MKRRVVITSMGLTSPIGHSPEAFFTALLEGYCGVRPHAGMQLSHSVGWVDADLDEDLPGNQSIMLDRVSKLALFAARQALSQQPLSAETLQQTGVYLGTGIGGIKAICDAFAGYHKIGPKIVQLLIPAAMPNAPTAHIAQLMSCTQEAQTYATACTAGSVAIGEAYRRIRDGYVDSALAGGTEAMIQPELLRAWEQLHVLCLDKDSNPEGGCRPFSIKRSGFALGEGAAMIVLETLEHALARGATPLAEIIGYGVSNDGTHPLRPNPHGQALAISRALKDADLKPEQVEYINAHATGTMTGDRIETEAIKTVFGDHAHRLAVSSIKGHMGHLIGACGALEAISTVKSLQTKTLPPTLHFAPGDELCDLDYVPNQARQLDNLDIAISNSFGMGGNNSVLVFKAYNE